MSFYAITLVYHIHLFIHGSTLYYSILFTIILNNWHNKHYTKIYILFFFNTLNSIYTNIYDEKITTLP